ncbi:SMP-30/gluconolactonase/LRE family protein [Salmonella enterica subsp. enterica]|nr:SMP-30/gluconolactonase/LRE family protein [Salmonella enterica subsp. enterica]
MAKEGLPDGAAMDDEGVYWARCLTFWRVAQVSHRKESSWKSTGCRYVVRRWFAFGGADMKTLFITTTRNMSAQEVADISGAIFYTCG